MKINIPQDRLIIFCLIAISLCILGTLTIMFLFNTPTQNMENGSYEEPMMEAPRIVEQNDLEQVEYDVNTGYFRNAKRLLGIGSGGSFSGILMIAFILGSAIALMPMLTSRKKITPMDIIGKIVALTIAFWLATTIFGVI